MRKLLATVAAVAVALFVVPRSSNATLYNPPATTYSSANPLPFAAGGLGPYAMPTAPPSSTDWFDGDSVLAGNGATTCSHTSSTPSGTCESDLVAIYDGASEVNKAIAGTCLEYTTVSGSPCNNNSATVGSLIDRYTNDLSSLSAGMRVFVEIGGNDVNEATNYPTTTQVTAATFRSNLVTVLNAIAAIVGSGNITLGEMPYQPQYNFSWTEKLNGVIVDVATQYGYRLAQTNSAIQMCSMDNNAGAVNCVASDDTHPSDTGQTYMAAAYEKANFINTVAEETAASGLAGLLQLSQFGTQNTALGSQAFAQRAGSYSTVVGGQAMGKLTTGNSNTAIGAQAMFSSTSGYTDTAIGAAALYSTGASNQTAVGANSLGKNTSGNNDTAVGYNSGEYITGGSTNNATSQTSVYLGASTMAAASGDQNEVVIGYNATGAGSNTTQIGNASMTKVITVGGYCPGNLTTAGTACYYSGTGAPTFSAPNGSQYIRYDGTTGSRLYYNTSGASTSGTTWTAMTSP